MRKFLITAALVALTPTGAARVDAHCQVPCGIYDDEARIAAIREDITTIEKAVTNIDDLAAAKDALSLNQAVRWINTKEQHASHIIDTVAQYFLTQKVKAPKGDGADERAHYLEMLADHHAVMTAAMKAKQTVSADAVASLKAAVDKLAKHYTSTPQTQHQH